MLDQQSLRDAEARCTQESAPRCQHTCPLHLDVRLFLSHMREGKWNEARKTLERHIPLAGIICHVCDHPCEDACLRRDYGGGLALGELERACLVRSTALRPLPRPPKQHTLAVLGAGLAGLVAAVEISRKGFPVTLWHEGAAGDALAQAFPQLPPDVLSAELETLAKSVTFCQAKLDSALLGKVQQEVNAVFVDAQAAPHVATPRQATDSVTLLVGGKVCCGGWPQKTPTGHVFASASQQAGEGRRAAQSLERLMGGLSLTAARTDADSAQSLHTDLQGLVPVQRVIASNGQGTQSKDSPPHEGGYNDDEARAEAARCLNCQCLACVHACAYLQKYGSYPRQYVRRIHNNASIVKGQHLANGLINGCTLCGQCTELCPERFSMSEICLSARQDMVQRNYMPPSAHDFALEDMDSAIEQALFWGEGSPAWALFPGCQLWAARGEQVLGVYNFLQQAPVPQKLQGGVGLILSCCGIPAHWGGREERFQALLAEFRQNWAQMGRPRLIVACASCLSVFEKFLPETQPVSLWEVLDEQMLPQPPLPNSQETRQTMGQTVGQITGQATGQAMGQAMGQTMAQTMGQAQDLSVHDPCSARHNRVWQKAVRSLATRSGARLHEAQHSGVTTACCGYGGLVWNAQPELADSISATLALQLPHTALASCIMCRDRLVSQGKACMHVLDLLSLNAAPVPPLQKALGLSARRVGRAALRRHLAGDSPQSRSPLAHGLSLHICETLLDDLEKKYILREDVEQAVAGLEATGMRFQEQNSGHYVGAWKPRHVTFWVRYSKDDTGYVLHDAWCHRMTVPGTSSVPCPPKPTVRPTSHPVASPDANSDASPGACKEKYA